MNFPLRARPPTLGFFCALGFHRYREVHAGQSIHRYLQCRSAGCADRIVRFAAHGYQPIQADWLNGGEWEAPRPGEFQHPPPPVGR
jgi:hypothetical protein